jgi:P22 coat protein - gene protein 5
MAITKALPQLWSGAIKAALLDAHVYGAAGVVNRDYEGEVSDYGVSVKVISVSPPAIKAYTKNTPIAAPDVLTDAETVLTIDQADYFNFSIDDIDQAQTRPKLMGEATRLAAWGLRDVSDAFIAAAMLADGTAAVADVTGAAPAASTVYDALVAARVALDQANVPSEGRFAILPPALYGLVLKDDRFIHATGAGDAVLANGEVGRMAGFTIRLSNNSPGTAPASNILFGHPIGYSFVEQILNTEPYRPQNMFADAVKGLYVFGGKTMYPQALGNVLFTGA